MQTGHRGLLITKVARLSNHTGMCVHMVAVGVVAGQWSVTGHLDHMLQTHLPGSVVSIHSPKVSIKHTLRKSPFFNVEGRGGGTFHL